ncbi:MAG: aldo/keto reductase [Sphingomonadales bacterium]
MKRTLGTRPVNPIGLGCMNICWAYAAPPPREAGLALLNQALDLGYDHLDTARIYGAGVSEAMIGEALAGRRRKFYLASKTGLYADGQRRWIDARPETLIASCEDSLRALRTDHIDLYYLHRRDFAVPIEDWAGAMGQLVQAGKIGGYGLSEMSMDTLRRAHAVHPVTAVQLEYSPWTRNPEIASLAGTAEMGIALVAFSPVGRGFLADPAIDPAGFGAQDIRRAMPRFQDENWLANQPLAVQFAALAAGAGVTPAQLALGWVLSRGDHVHAIPGTTNPAHLAENIARADWRPDAALVAAVDALINRQSVQGPRYNKAMQATIDSEEFAD